MGTYDSLLLQRNFSNLKYLDPVILNRIQQALQVLVNTLPQLTAPL